MPSDNVALVGSPLFAFGFLDLLSKDMRAAKNAFHERGQGQGAKSNKTARAA